MNIGYHNPSYTARHSAYPIKFGQNQNNLPPGYLPAVTSIDVKAGFPSGLEKKLKALSPGDTLTVGRASTNQFVTRQDKLRVSKSHGQFRKLSDGTLQYQDLGSTNGSYYHDVSCSVDNGGQKLSPNQWITMTPGSRLELSSDYIITIP